MRGSRVPGLSSREAQRRGNRDGVAATFAPKNSLPSAGLLRSARNDAFSATLNGYCRWRRLLCRQMPEPWPC